MEDSAKTEVPLKCSTSSAKVDSGLACIKPEFIDLHYKPRLVAAYLPEDTVEEIQQIISLRKKAAGDDQTLEPASKKPKLKGRNKKRPMEKRPPVGEKLCPNIIGQRICSFGDRCKFSHDIAKFMESRPKLIGEKCYVFETFGHCPYGVTCLFAEQHMLNDMTSFTNMELHEKFINEPPRVKNVISKDMQIRLRKKEYNFKRANKVIRQFQEKFKDKGQNVKRKDTKADESTGNQENVVEDVKCVRAISTEEPEKGEDSSACCHQHQSDTSSIKGVETADNCLQKDSSDSLNCNVLAEEKPFIINSPLEQEVCPNDSADHVVEKCLSSTTDCQLLGFEHKDPEMPEKSSVMKSHRLGCVSDEDVIRIRDQEKRKIVFRNKLYLAPLTTVGNLPFRRLCKKLGADVTCGEMAMSSNLLQGQASEWALLKRHQSETLFGAQLCGSYPDTMTRAAQVIVDTMDVDFIDVNLGCPIDMVVQKGEGCAVMGRIGRLEQIVHGMSAIMDIPLTVKMRTGLQEDKHTAHTLLPKLRDWGVSMVTVHGRSREQRYTKVADWNYIKTCVDVAKPLDIFGNGDILSYADYNNSMSLSGAAGCMIARGALIKPWLFTEIKEQRHWDISASERLEIVREYVNYGLEHWGSDQQGVANTRRFLLEWLSFFHRYIPVGVLERVPQRINEKPPHYFGRNDLETLMASSNCADWIKISEMFLGPVPSGFTFLPKHRANAYQ